jgi:hypothetical protein
MAEGCLCNLQIVPITPIGQCAPMVDSLLLLIAGAFLLAGFIKGVLGLGLPTVAMGLLAVTMPPAQALAIVIVPAIVTNIWQTFVGPYLRDIIARLWPLMVGTAAGIWLNRGMLTGPYAPYATVVLGVLLVIYAFVGLSKFSFKVARSDEKWIGGIVGLVTGVISATTGVQGAGRVLHGGDAGPCLQPDHGGAADGGDRAAGRGSDGGFLCRDVHRADGADADETGPVPPLVPDRDDLARALPCRQRALVKMHG